MKTLYLMLGFPGAGKTTVAKQICELTGAQHVWADQKRKKLFALRVGSYSKEENVELYDLLNKQTEELLQTGHSVVFDTAFNHYTDREKMRVLAAQTGAVVQIIWVTTARELAKERAVESEHPRKNRVLGAMTDEHFEKLSDKLEKPLPNEPHITIDGQNVTKESVGTALAARS